MRIIITENQYNLLTEQSTVYTDINEYKKTLKAYNKKMAVYQMSLELYKESGAWSRNYQASNAAFNTPNMKKLTKLTGFASIDIPYFMDAYYRCKNNLPNDNGYEMTNCDNGYREYKNLGSPEIDKWYKIPTYYENGNFNQNMWIPIFKKPNIKKPIFKKPEPVEPVKLPDVPKPVTKTPSVVNYRELKSETTFAPHIKSGTPIVQVGTYYMTYPEFEAYKKSRPNTTFKKQ
jgi:hypothetical protein